MKPHARAVAKRPCIRQQFDHHIEPARRLERTGFTKRRSSLEVGELDASEIDGHAMTGVGRWLVLSVNLNATRARGQCPRQHGKVLSFAQPSRDQRPGGNGPEAFEREDAIHRQPRAAARIASRDARGKVPKHRP